MLRASQRYKYASEKTQQILVRCQLFHKKLGLKSQQISSTL